MTSPAPAPEPALEPRQPATAGEPDSVGAGVVGVGEGHLGQRGGLTPMLRVLIGLAAAVVLFAGLSLAREVVGPLALGAVMAIICHPVRRPLERAGWPRWLATTAVVTLAYLTLALLAFLLVIAGIRFADLLPQFSDELSTAVADLVALLERLGIDQAASDAMSSFLDPARLAVFAQEIGGTALGVITSFFFVLAYVIFMAADASRYSHADETYGPSARPALARFGAFTSNVRRYYVVNATFGAIVAVIDGIALWVLSVPAPLVWAILSFVTNFVPNIGFVLGLVPPTLLALVVSGWQSALAVVVIYCVANVLLQVLIQPKVVSDAVSISLTLSFFSVIFWTFIIGPLGAILSVPLTLLVRAVVLENDPGTRWLRWLTGDTSVAGHRAEGPGGAGADAGGSEGAEGAGAPRPGAAEDTSGAREQAAPGA